MYKIEKNIPIPQRLGIQFNFREMEVGDSILIPCEPDSLEKSRAASALGKFKKETGLKFVTRQMPEGMRIWRVA